MSVTGVQSKSHSNYPKLKKDIKQVEGAVDRVSVIDKKIADMAKGAITPFRRISSLSQKVKDHEYVAAIGLGSLAVANLPEDIRDLQQAVRQINDGVLSDSAKNYMKTKHNKVYKNFIEYDELYDRKNYQHDFSFFRGTMLHNLVNPNRAEDRNQAEWVVQAKKWLVDQDDTVLDTKFGKFVKRKMGVEVADKTYGTNIKHISYTEKKQLFVKARSFKGGNQVARLVCRAMARIPKLSVLALGLIELPKIVGAAKKGDNSFEKADEVARQTIKSGINVASILGGIAAFGAVGHKYGKAAGSLIGMGVGAVVGAVTSKEAQKLVGAES